MDYGLRAASFYIGLKVINILKEYPAPWKAEKVGSNIYLWANNQEPILITGRQDHFSLFEFVAKTVNNSVRPRITDVLCECSCGWRGIVYDCEPDVDGDGNLGCPRCLKIVEVV